MNQLTRDQVIALVEEVDSDFYDGDKLGEHGGWFAYFVEDDVLTVRATPANEDGDEGEETEYRWRLVPA